MQEVHNALISVNTVSCLREREGGLSVRAPVHVVLSEVRASTREKNRNRVVRVCVCLTSPDISGARGISGHREE